MDSDSQSSLRDRARARAGVALFAALAMITLIALLTGGALAAFRLAARSSGLSRADAVLGAAADYAINSVAANARQLALDTLPMGVAQSFAPDVPGADGVTAVVVATRLIGGIVWLVGDVTSGAIGDGHRRVNVVARWRPPGPTPPSPLVARGGVRLAGDVTFAVDTLGDVDCRSALVPSVTTPPGVSVTSAGGVSTSSSATASDSSTYFLATSQLAQLAGGYGVTHVTRDTTIAGGSFDGILIVDGALTITGPFAVSGIVVSRGPVVAVTGGLTVIGAVMSFASPAGGQPAMNVSGATIRYSRCTIATVFRRAIPLRPVRERSWAELF